MHSSQPNHLIPTQHGNRAPSKSIRASNVHGTYIVSQLGTYICTSRYSRGLAAAKPGEIPGHEVVFSSPWLCMETSRALDLRQGSHGIIRRYIRWVSTVRTYRSARLDWVLPWHGVSRSKKGLLNRNCMGGKGERE